MLVLDEGDANVSLAVFAERASGRDGDFCLFHESHGEIDRSLPLEVVFGDLGPDWNKWLLDLCMLKDAAHLRNGREAE